MNSNCPPSSSMVSGNQVTSQVMELVGSSQNQRIGFLLPSPDFIAKVKTRFRNESHKYEKFIGDICQFVSNSLNKQQQSKDSLLCEKEAEEIYCKMSKLFENHKDLLLEFSDFLTPKAAAKIQQFGDLRCGLQTDYARKLVEAVQETDMKNTSLSLKTTESSDVTFVQGTSTDITATALGTAEKTTYKNSIPVKCDNNGNGYDLFYFFDIIGSSVSTEAYYDFLQSLYLFNDGLLSQEELIKFTSTSTFANKPELFQEFKKLLKETKGDEIPRKRKLLLSKMEKASQGLRMICDSEEKNLIGMKIKHNSCFYTLGQSYLKVPKTFIKPECSGKTRLCHEVLNDVWTCIPNPRQEKQSVPSTTEKLAFIKSIDTIEDERYELDMIIETNNSAINLLEKFLRNMKRQPDLHQLGTELCENLFIRTSIYRLYSDKGSPISDCILQSLKNNPQVAVPRILMRLKSKEQEWREVQKRLNQKWQEEIDCISYPHTDSR